MQAEIPCFNKTTTDPFFTKTVLKDLLKTSTVPWVLNGVEALWKDTESMLQRVEIFKAIPLGNFLQLLANITLPQNSSILFLNKNLTDFEIRTKDFLSKLVDYTKYLSFDYYDDTDLTQKIKKYQIVMSSLHDYVNRTITKKQLAENIAGTAGLDAEFVSATRMSKDFIYL